MGYNLKCKYSNPKKSIACVPVIGTTCFLTNFDGDESTSATNRRDEEIKKRKRKIKKHIVANWLFAQTVHVVGSKLYLACE